MIFHKHEFAEETVRGQAYFRKGNLPGEIVLAFDGILKTCECGVRKFFPDGGGYPVDVE